MFRKALLGVFAAAALSLLSPTLASARGFGGGFHGGGFHGEFRGGWGGARLGFYPYYGGYSYGLYGCYRPVTVYTPFGPRVRRVWVCG